MSLFKDRRDAGLQLAHRLQAYAGNAQVIVLALPRGGVPVAFEIAQALAAPLDLLLVRKLGTPGQEELAMGAIAGDDICVFNEEVIRGAGVSRAQIDAEINKERQELVRRNNTYRQGKAFPQVTQKIVILVDDGIATGATVEAAILALRQKKAAQIILAIPVAPASTLAHLQSLVDHIICLETPAEPFYGVAYWYDAFPQLEDNEVIDLLKAFHDRYS